MYEEDRRRIDLDHAQRLLLTIEGALSDIRAGRRVKEHTVVWPAGLDRSICHSLPLTVRTMNCLTIDQSMMIGDDQLLVEDLMSLPNFGVRSLKDLLFATEDYLLNCGHQSAPTVQDHTWLYLMFCARELSRAIEKVGEDVDSTSGTTSLNSDQANIEHYKSNIGVAKDKALLESVQNIERVIQQVGSVHAIWREIKYALSPAITVMLETGLATKLTDMLSPKLLEIASILELKLELDSIQVENVMDKSHSLVSRIMENLEQRIRTLSAKEHIIIKGRILRDPKMTLEQVGDKLEITRERVRQIQAKIERDIRLDVGKELNLLSQVLSATFAPIEPVTELRQRLKEIFPEDGGLAVKIIHTLLISSMGYKAKGEMFIRDHVKTAISNIRGIASSCADDAALVNEEALITEVYELAPELIEHWEWLLQQTKLHRLHGQLSLRNSAKARAKAALVAIGRPATKNEVGELCGMGAVKVGGAFSNLPSVVRADVERWGLKEWVDDEYEGIAKEIIQRINEDGGATTTERLLTELPERFGVDPKSVYAYMQAPKFVINDGCISLASKSSIRLRDLEDVIDGIDDTGAPYWTFQVEARYFEGYSVSNVPPEIAKALGCDPDSGISVQMENLPDCRDLSVNWSLASNTGASLGYVGEPLKRLSLEPGDRARVVIKGPSLVRLVAHDVDGPNAAKDSAAAILDRIMRRKKVL